MIVDAHTHIFPPWLQERRQEYVERDATFGDLYSNPGTKLATAEELVAAMDGAGIDVAVVAGIGWSDAGLAKECNDYLLEAVQHFPHRLVAFCGVNPVWGEAAVREVDRCARQGAKGVGELHPDTQGFDLGSREAMDPVMEAVKHQELVLLTHASEPVGHLYPGKGRTTPNILVRFISHFPGTPIVCAHWGGGLPFYALMPEIREALKDVYFDSAATPLLYDPQIFLAASHLVSPSHILLGTDYPLVSQTRVLDQLRAAPLGQESLDGILGQNAARLLGLATPQGASEPKGPTERPGTP